MELRELVRALRARWVLTLIVVVAAAATAATVYKSAKSASSGSATVQLLVDSSRSALSDLQQDPAPLITRASVFAQLMASSDVLQAIAQRAGVPVGDVTGEGP